MIAVILPTRGLSFTQVEESISRNLEGKEYQIFRSFTLPIPDCENYLVGQALLKNPTHLLFVEEDTVMPQGGLEKMLAVNSDIVCIDYAVEGWSCTAQDKETHELLWCGLGCTLVKKEVFDAIEKPYFRTDKALRLNDWPIHKDDWIDVPQEKRYGGQDIWFCRQAIKKGFHIVQVEGECKHLRIESLGVRDINNGLHTIVEKKKIEKQQYI